jgi:hypothetical protein
MATKNQHRVDSATIVRLSDLAARGVITDAARQLYIRCLEGNPPTYLMEEEGLLEEFLRSVEEKLNSAS